jgi:hypothetical protein
MRHNAPPVVYPVGRFVWGRVAFVFVTVCSALGLVVWQTESEASRVWFVAWILWVACSLGTAVLGPRQTLTHGELVWTGEAWFWLCRGEDQRFQEQKVLLEKGFDTGSGLLLWVKLVDAQGVGQSCLRGAWFCEAQLPSKWHGFRCAVYSRTGDKNHGMVGQDTAS